MAEPQRRLNSRLELLLDAAAHRFARQGYRETTVRDVAAAIDMLPGSVYYHFSSKEQLLLAVYRQGVQRLCVRADAALGTAGTDPWDRLEALLVAHLETALDQSDYARVLIRVLPDQVPGVASELASLRADYEVRFRQAVDALPVADGTDRKLLRLLLLGAANWSEIWYTPGQATPADIARHFVKMLREPLL